MDPISITSAALGCVKLIHDLGKGIVALRAAIQGVKEIDNELAAFQGELDALQMALTVLDREIEGSRGKLPEAIAKWWPEASLENILQSAVKTFDRLNEIFVDVNKDRRALERPRQYLSSKFYEDEIRHLRHRLSTYVSCLNLPVILLAIMRQQPSAAPVSDFRLDLLSSKLSALDTSISSLQESFTQFRSQTSVASSSSSQPQIAAPNSQTEATIRDTKVLIDMAESISFNVSTAASRLSTAPSIAWDASSRIDEDLASLFEAALPNRSQNRVLSWIHGQPDAAESESGVHSPPSTASHDIWTRDGASAAESTTTISLMSPRGGINPQQEFRNIKLKRAVDYVNRGDTQRAIRVFEELLNQAAKSPALQPETDIFAPYARALVESASQPVDYIASTIIKYPGIESQLIDLSLATAQKLLAQGNCAAAKPHIMALRQRWALDVHIKPQPTPRGRPSFSLTQPTAPKPPPPGIKSILDIGLARCLFEELKAANTDGRDQPSLSYRERSRSRSDNVLNAQETPVPLGPPPARPRSTHPETLAEFLKTSTPLPQAPRRRDP